MNNIDKYSKQEYKNNWPGINVYKKILFKPAKERLSDPMGSLSILFEVVSFTNREVELATLSHMAYNLVTVYHLKIY